MTASSETNITISRGLFLQKSHLFFLSSNFDFENAENPSWEIFNLEVLQLRSNEFQMEQELSNRN